MRTGTSSAKKSSSRRNTKPSDGTDPARISSKGSSKKTPSRRAKPTESDTDLSTASFRRKAKSLNPLTASLIKLQNDARNCLKIQGLDETEINQIAFSDYNPDNHQISLEERVLKLNSKSALALIAYYENVLSSATPPWIEDVDSAFFFERDGSNPPGFALRKTWASLSSEAAQTSEPEPSARPRAERRSDIGIEASRGLRDRQLAKPKASLEVRKTGLKASVKGSMPRPRNAPVGTLERTYRELEKLRLELREIAPSPLRAAHARDIVSERVLSPARRSALEALSISDSEEKTSRTGIVLEVEILEHIVLPKIREQAPSRLSSAKSQIESLISKGFREMGISS